MADHLTLVAPGMIKSSVLLPFLLLEMLMMMTRPFSIRRLLPLLALAATLLTIACGNSGNSGSGGSGGGGCEASDDVPVPSLTTSFLKSSTGTTAIEIGDEIEFEVCLTLKADQKYHSVTWALTGDLDAATDLVPPYHFGDWPGFANNVTKWEWNYVPGRDVVNFSTRFLTVPKDRLDRIPLPAPVMRGFGFTQEFGRLGTGIPSVVGTVTIKANALGEFEAGPLCIDNLGSFEEYHAPSVETETCIPASFTVGPAPRRAAVLFGIGFAVLGLVTRRVHSS